MSILLIFLTVCGNVDTVLVYEEGKLTYQQKFSHSDREALRYLVSNPKVQTWVVDMNKGGKCA